MVLVDLGEGVCVICLVFRVFFKKKDVSCPDRKFGLSKKISQTYV
jgi:hypothetical protein